MNRSYATPKVMQERQSLTLRATRHRVHHFRGFKDGTVSRQQGLSLFGFLMLLIVLAFGMNVGLTLGPHYMDNRSIQNVVATLSPSVWKTGNKTKIHDAVNKGLKVNSVRTLKSEDILKITKAKGSIRAVLDYEVRENLIGNVDVVLTFNEEYNR